MDMETNDSDAPALPTRDELLAALDQLTGLSEEDREELRQHLLSENQPKNVPVEPLFTSQFFILLSFMTLVAVIFVAYTSSSIQHNMEEDDIDTVHADAQNISDIGGKILELWARLNESLSEDIIDRMKSMMKQYKDLSGNEKEEFEVNMKNMLTDAINRAASARFWSATTATAILATCIAAVFIIFVFFGYKLYKSLKEKERKRDEKKKLRQQKKKK